MDSFDRETGEVIERRQSLPAISPETGTRNLIFASPDCAEIFGALSDFQGAVEPPKKTKTAEVIGTTKAGAAYKYKYQYAPLDEIHAAIKKPMSDAGLAHRQFLAVRDGQHVMRTIVGHKGTGQWFGCDYPIFFDQSKGAQGFASGVTYARRYGLMLALGVVAEDDDDANVADGQPATVSGRNTSQERAGAPQTQGSAPARTTHPQRQQAAPAPGDADKRAVELYSQIKAEIDMADTVPPLDKLLADEMTWDELRARVTDARDEKAANETVAGLKRRITDRKGLLLGEQG